MSSSTPTPQTSAPATITDRASSNTNGPLVDRKGNSRATT